MCGWQLQKQISTAENPSESRITTASTLRAVMKCTTLLQAAEPVLNLLRWRFSGFSSADTTRLLDYREIWHNWRGPKVPYLGFSAPKPVKIRKFANFVAITGDSLARFW